MNRGLPRHIVTLGAGLALAACVPGGESVAWPDGLSFELTLLYATPADGPQPLVVSEPTLPVALRTDQELLLFDSTQARIEAIDGAVVPALAAAPALAGITIEARESTCAREISNEGTVFSAPVSTLADVFRLDGDVFRALDASSPEFDVVMDLRLRAPREQAGCRESGVMPPFGRDEAPLEGGIEVFGQLEGGQNYTTFRLLLPLTEDRVAAGSGRIVYLLERGQPLRDAPGYLLRPTRPDQSPTLSMFALERADGRHLGVVQGPRSRVRVRDYALGDEGLELVDTATVPIGRFASAASHANGHTVLADSMSTSIQFSPTPTGAYQPVEMGVTFESVVALEDAEYEFFGATADARTLLFSVAPLRVRDITPEALLPFGRGLRALSAGPAGEIWLAVGTTNPQDVIDIPISRWDGEAWSTVPTYFPYTALACSGADECGLLPLRADQPVLLSVLDGRGPVVGTACLGVMVVDERAPSCEAWMVGLPGRGLGVQFSDHPISSMARGFGRVFLGGRDGRLYELRD